MPLDLTQYDLIDRMGAAIFERWKKLDILIGNAGILGKLTPQIPVYFISVPFVLAGGFLILYFTSGEMLQIFMGGFSEWLAKV